MPVRQAARLWGSEGSWAEHGDCCLSQTRGGMCSERRGLGYNGANRVMYITPHMEQWSSQARVETGCG